MREAINTILRPATRAWLYGIFAALGTVVLGYGYMTGEQVAAWLGVVSAVLSIGGNVLAASMTDPKTQNGMPEGN